MRRARTGSWLSREGTSVPKLLAHREFIVCHHMDQRVPRWAVLFDALIP